MNKQRTQQIIEQLESNEAFEPYRDRIDQNIGNPGVAGPKTTSGQILQKLARHTLKYEKHIK